MGSDRTIKIFDTTLHNGEQSPGASMNLIEKMKIAHALVDLGVDIIEAGFPIASPGDFEAVREISVQVRGTTICGLARCNDKDINRAWQAVEPAAQPRIHVFLATSAIHRGPQAANDARRNHRAHRGGSPTGSRLLRRCGTNFRPKTPLAPSLIFFAKSSRRRSMPAPRPSIFPTPSATPRPPYGKFATCCVQRVPNISDAVISVHCHNDLGLAVANSLAAVENGAGQIECTINGLGEQAGNCSLEEVVMALRTRGDYYHADTHVKSQWLVPTSRLVSGITGLAVPRNKAIVGRNAFAHEAGIHQDGMLKEPSTYEIMRPEDVGFSKTELVLGKHSGRAALADRAGRWDST